MAHGTMISMKLSEYGTWNGIKHKAAWNPFKAGKIEGAHLDESGQVVVLDPIHASFDKAAIYGRAFTDKQKGDLEGQIKSLTDNHGIAVHEVPSP